MKIGIFYEIGAYGTVGEYLSRPDWVSTSHQRASGGKELYVPLKYANEYANWKVFAVEALPRNMANMLSNNDLTQRNNLHLINATIGPYNKMEIVDIVDFAKIKGGMYGTEHSAYLKESNIFTEERKRDSISYYTFTITLDQLFMSLNAHPTVLRIDIEGAEVEVLESYSFQPKPRIIQVDCHQRNRKACARILQDQGYTIIDEYWGDHSDDIYAELP
jgi:FkbM family methyltransferase